MDEWAMGRLMQVSCTLKGRHALIIFKMILMMTRMKIMIVNTTLYLY